MRILVFCADPGIPIHGPSGASAHLRAIARAYQTLGHTVLLAALKAHDHRGRHDVPLRVPALTIGRPTWPDGLRTLGEHLDSHRLAHRLRGMRFDLVHERHSLHSTAGLRLARHLRVPHLLELNAPLSLERNRTSRAERRVLCHTDHVLAVSPWLADWARSQGARSVHVVPNGSDLTAPEGVQPPEDGRIHVVHHGSRRPWHGTDHLPRLLEHLPEAHLTLVGGPPLRHPQVHWRPTLDPEPLAHVLARAHVGLLPYPRNAPPWFDPLKLHDYRAIGLPVVGSLHPAARLADRRVDVHDLQGMADAVRELARYPRRPRLRPWTTVAVESLAVLPSPRPADGRADLLPGPGSPVRLGATRKGTR